MGRRFKNWRLKAKGVVSRKQAPKRKQKNWRVKKSTPWKSRYKPKSKSPSRLKSVPKKRKSVNKKVLVTDNYGGRKYLSREKFNLYVRSGALGRNGKAGRRFEVHEFV